jgi:diadenosine tetraphosphate (Ap4A) HIT family hydrolase
MSAVSRYTARSQLVRGVDSVAEQGTPCQCNQAEEGDRSVQPQRPWRGDGHPDTRPPGARNPSTSVFSKIIAGELPGRFVWHDSTAVAFLSIAPIAPGHTLVVPRCEFDQWTDADPAVLTHCTTVAHHIGQAVKLIWNAPRAGLIIAGFEVAHLHLHVFPAWHLQNFTFAGADQKPNPDALDESAERIRCALREIGHRDTVPVQ